MDSHQPNREPLHPTADRGFAHRPTAGRVRRGRGPVALAAALAVAAAVGGAGCTYMRNVAVQGQYRASQMEQPSLWTSKHLLERDTSFVYGRLVDGPAEVAARTLSVAAFSSGYRDDEIVDICHLGRNGSYYGLNLPAGKYRLMVLADLDDDGAYERNEILGYRRLRVDAEACPDKVARDVDLPLSAPRELPLATLPLPVPPDRGPVPDESVFFPRGTLRSLDDPIFSREMSELGMYDPAAFMEAAPMMFYALEEDLGHKVPVIFVHGIGGSARQFEAIVARLDRSHYKPWFFHYPSGMDLRQVSRLFYDIFLSGKLIPASEMPTVIVAHSMGGLVVREALNLHGARPGEANLDLVVTMATPFGGMDTARLGLRYAPLVVPAWRDLDPDGSFIVELFRQALAEGVAHHAMYAFSGRADPDQGKGSDGVVPLESQLAARARAGFTDVAGFRAGHAEILQDPAAIDHLLSLIGRVRSIFPPEHMSHLARGGFDVPSGGAYTAIERVLLKSYGQQFRALANGELQPFHPSQEHFIAVARGQATPENPAESAWLKFRAEFPDLAGRHATGG